jgi:ethanolamine ammonia-lyase large subunit
MSYNSTIDGVRWVFPDLKTLLAKASPARSGDPLAGIVAQSALERAAAQMALADRTIDAPQVLPRQLFTGAEDGCVANNDVT